MRDRKPITSLAEFVAEVSHYRREWHETVDGDFWFRGEPDAESKTALKPSLYRPEKEFDVLLRREQMMFSEFKRLGSQMSESEPANNGDWYFLMQHHGVPTRLLDWSDGAFIALHFALKRPLRCPSCESARQLPDAAVYILDSNWLNDVLEAELRDFREAGKRHEAGPARHKDAGVFERYLPGDPEQDLITIKPPMVVDPYHFTRRFAAQRSRFIVFGRNPNALDEISGRPGSRLHQIRISQAAVGCIREDLRSCGISESTIFPDLDGLGREFNETFEHLLWSDAANIPSGSGGC